MNGATRAFLHTNQYRCLVVILFSGDKIMLSKQKLLKVNITFLTLFSINAETGHSIFQCEDWLCSFLNASTFYFKQAAAKEVGLEYSFPVRHQIHAIVNRCQ